MQKKSTKRTAKRKAPVSTMAPKTLRGQTIPIIGTAGPEGIVLFEEERARKEAKTVAAFLNSSGSPDFLTEAMLTTIDDAFDHFGLPKPEADEESGWTGQGDYDAQNLQPLFLKTKLTSWGALYPDRERVLDAVHELLHNPQVPGDLFEAVAQFACDQSNHCSENVFHSRAVLTEVLDSVLPEDLRGAKTQEASHDAN